MNRHVTVWSVELCLGKVETGTVQREREDRVGELSGRVTRHVPVVPSNTC